MRASVSCVKLEALPDGHAAAYFFASEVVSILAAQIPDSHQHGSSFAIVVCRLLLVVASQGDASSSGL